MHERPSTRIVALTVVEHGIPGSLETARAILATMMDEGMLPTHMGFHVPENPESQALSALRTEMIQLLNLAAELQVLKEGSFVDPGVLDCPRDREVAIGLNALHSDGMIADETQSSYAMIESLRACRDAGMLPSPSDMLQVAERMVKYFVSLGNAPEAAESMLKAECDAIDDGIKLCRADELASERIKKPSAKDRDRPL